MKESSAYEDWKLSIISSVTQTHDQELLEKLFLPSILSVIASNPRFPMPNCRVEEFTTSLLPSFISEVMRRPNLPTAFAFAAERVLQSIVSLYCQTIIEQTNALTDAVSILIFDPTLPFYHGSILLPSQAYHPFFLQNVSVIFADSSISRFDSFLSTSLSERFGHFFAVISPILRFFPLFPSQRASLLINSAFKNFSQTVTSIDFQSLPVSDLISVNSILSSFTSFFQNSHFLCDFAVKISSPVPLFHFSVLLPSMSALYYSIYESFPSYPMTALSSFIEKFLDNISIGTIPAFITLFEKISQSPLCPPMLLSQYWAVTIAQKPPDISIFMISLQKIIFRVPRELFCSFVDYVIKLGIMPKASLLFFRKISKICSKSQLERIRQFLIQSSDSSNDFNKTIACFMQESPPIILVQKCAPDATVSQQKCPSENEINSDSFFEKAKSDELLLKSATDVIIHSPEIGKFIESCLTNKLCKVSLKMLKQISDLADECNSYALADHYQRFFIPKEERTSISVSGDLDCSFYVALGTSAKVIENIIASKLMSSSDNLVIESSDCNYRVKIKSKSTTELPLHPCHYIFQEVDHIIDLLQSTELGLEAYNLLERLPPPQIEKNLFLKGELNQTIWEELLPIYCPTLFYYRLSLLGLLLESASTQFLTDFISSGGLKFVLISTLFLAKSLAWSDQQLLLGFRVAKLALSASEVIEGSERGFLENQMVKPLTDYCLELYEAKKRLVPAFLEAICLLQPFKAPENLLEKCIFSDDLLIRNAIKPLFSVYTYEDFITNHTEEAILAGNHEFVQVLRDSINRFKSPDSVFEKVEKAVKESFTTPEDYFFIQNEFILPSEKSFFMDLFACISSFSETCNTSEIFEFLIKNVLISPSFHNIEVIPLLKCLAKKNLPLIPAMLNLIEPINGAEGKGEINQMIANSLFFLSNFNEIFYSIISFEPSADEQWIIEFQLLLFSIRLSLPSKVGKIPSFLKTDSNYSFISSLLGKLNPSSVAGSFLQAKISQDSEEFSEEKFTTLSINFAGSIQESLENFFSSSSDGKITIHRMMTKPPQILILHLLNSIPLTVDRVIKSDAFSNESLTYRNTWRINGPQPIVVYTRDGYCAPFKSSTDLRKLFKLSFYGSISNEQSFCDFRKFLRDLNFCDEDSFKTFVERLKDQPSDEDFQLLSAKIGFHAGENKKLASFIVGFELSHRMICQSFFKPAVKFYCPVICSAVSAIPEEDRTEFVRSYLSEIIEADALISFIPVIKQLDKVDELEIAKLLSVTIISLSANGPNLNPLFNFLEDICGTADKGGLDAFFQPTDFLKVCSNPINIFSFLALFPEDRLMKSIPPDPSFLPYIFISFVLSDRLKAEKAFLAYLKLFKSSQIFMLLEKIIALKSNFSGNFSTNFFRSLPYWVSNFLLSSSLDVRNKFMLLLQTFIPTLSLDHTKLKAALSQPDLNLSKAVFRSLIACMPQMVHICQILTNQIRKNSNESISSPAPEFGQLLYISMVSGDCFSELCLSGPAITKALCDLSSSDIILSGSFSFLSYFVLLCIRRGDPSVFFASASYSDILSSFSNLNFGSLLVKSNGVIAVTLILLTPKENIQECLRSSLVSSFLPYIFQPASRVGPMFSSFVIAHFSEIDKVRFCEMLWTSSTFAIALTNNSSGYFLLSARLLRMEPDLVRILDGRKLHNLLFRAIGPVLFESAWGVESDPKISVRSDGMVCVAELISAYMDCYLEANCKRESIFGDSPSVKNMKKWLNMRISISETLKMALNPATNKLPTFKGYFDLLRSFARCNKSLANQVFGMIKVDAGFSFVSRAPSIARAASAEFLDEFIRDSVESGMICRKAALDFLIGELDLVISQKIFNHSVILPICGRISELIRDGDDIEEKLSADLSSIMGCTNNCFIFSAKIIKLLRSLHWRGHNPEIWITKALNIAMTVDFNSQMTSFEFSINFAKFRIPAIFALDVADGTGAPRNIFDGIKEKIVAIRALGLGKGGAKFDEEISYLLGRI